MTGPPSIYDHIKFDDEQGISKEEYMKLGIVEGPCLERVMYSSFYGMVLGAYCGLVDLGWNTDHYAAMTVKKSGKTAQLFNPNHVSVVLGACRTPVVWLALTGFTFSGVDCLLESHRMKRDPWNAVGGGFAAGMVMGSVYKRIDLMLASSIFCGVTMGIIDFCGNTIVYDWERLDDLRDQTRLDAFVESQEMKDMKEKYKKYFVDENGRDLY